MGMKALGIPVIAQSPTTEFIEASANKEKLPAMLSQFSIRSKIIAVVAFLLVAMTGMGLLAVKNMRAMNADTSEITTSWLPSVRVLGDLRAGVITYRNVIRQHMLSETMEGKLAMEKTLDRKSVV